jgi:hypothetical protein
MHHKAYRQVHIDYDDMPDGSMQKASANCICFVNPDLTRAKKSSLNSKPWRERDY